MNSEQLFGMALGLHTPWQVDSIEFKPGTKGGEELHLTIQNFINMAYFLCGKLDFSFARRSPA